MLILDEEYLRHHVSMEDMLQAMEEAFHLQASGDFWLPDRLSYPQAKGTFVMMPCFSQKYYSTKLLGTFPDNIRLGKPSINGIMVLYHAQTGEVAALLNAAYLTGLRTGALGGLSAKYLAAEDCESLALLGAGTQGLFQTWAAAAVRPVRDVYVYDPYSESLASFASRLHQYRPDLRVHPMNSAAEAAKAGRLIITCTTSATPVIPDEPSLFAGKHVIAMGSYEPAKRELPPAVLKSAAAVYVDTLFAREESGDLAIPIAEGWQDPNAIEEFCHLVRQGGAMPELQEQTTLFKCVGMGLFDLYIAQKIYELACASGEGVELSL